MHPRAGQPARQEDLVDLDDLLAAYDALTPDPAVPGQAVVFGTSGHRGSSLDTAFNDAHIAAITQAIVEHRAAAGIEGPLLIGADPHALSAPAHRTALEVLTGNGVDVRVDARGGWVPTPALSRAIIAMNARGADRGRADGIVITPSHNPPRDGGFKYNPPHGGPADSATTSRIAARANELLADGNRGVRRARELDPGTYDFLGEYVDALPGAIDVEAIRRAGVRLGADPLGGASVAYWAAIRDRLGLDVTVLGEAVDPRWAFMPLDWDGRIRMDPSSPHAMAALVAHAAAGHLDVLTGNDADADRHGVVTSDGGLMNPNHYLAVAIDHLGRHRPGWPRTAAIGKTLVSSAIIDRVVGALGRELVEVPVGFKWFVDGLADGSLVFGGEESAGATFLQRDGGVWTTDKDGILLALLAAEVLAVSGESPAARYRALTAAHGEPAYARVDAPASATQRARLGHLTPDDVTATAIAGEPIRQRLAHAPGNGAAIGGLKVTTDSAWFAVRPSGTEDVMKVYAESFRGPEHLAVVLEEAQATVAAALRH
ncbi:MAG TPA: phosphoglucomutase (alpha-D-glucose-1,6-bisphosphate-dependent) [Microbacteriaceae bacterium]|nr:phosphoglucomutase (alpha-D-glucose-1,6-bisphosphate-dependent) [Microbacteriaceae bacterium]